MGGGGSCYFLLRLFICLCNPPLPAPHTENGCMVVLFLLLLLSCFVVVVVVIVW